MLESLQAEADQEELDDFINTLARLRADELVAEKPGADGLKKYGLDRPEASWRLESDDKEVLHLVVGARENKGPRRYARLAGRDLVFLLDPKLSARVVGEFRPRAVWAAPTCSCSTSPLASTSCATWRPSPGPRRRNRCREAPGHRPGARCRGMRQAAAAKENNRRGVRGWRKTTPTGRLQPLQSSSGIH